MLPSSVHMPPATSAAIMLADAGRIQEEDTRHFNKKREAQGLPPAEPLYTLKDAAESMRYFVSISYDFRFSHQ